MSRKFLKKLKKQKGKKVNALCHILSTYTISVMSWGLGKKNTKPLYLRSILEKQNKIKPHKQQKIVS